MKTIIDDALILATKAHKGQFRKFSDQEYIVHPIDVCEKVKEWLASSESENLSEEEKIQMQCAALLHDVLEDCPKISSEDIIQCTNKETYLIILDLTNPSKGSKEPRSVRKKMDRDHLEFVSKKAKLIKLIDRIVNLDDMRRTNPDQKFVKLYATESLLLAEKLTGVSKTLSNKLDTIIKEILS